jgi:hypothetical protein
MVMDQIDELKEKYTDKYVVVDAQRPELARFRDVVGQVKTVNMSGRALVEFGDYHLNIGWYDIDPSFLKVVDKPAPKPKEAPARKPEAKAPAAAEPKPAAKAAPAGKQSTADILAALRGGGGAAAKAPAADKPAAAKPAEAAPAKTDRSKMSVAEMLAAARAQGAGGTAAAPAPAPEAKTPAEEKPAKEEAAAPAPVAKKPSGEKVDRTTMTTAQIIAWCREHDAK